jgi:hypothetical protein
MSLPQRPPLRKPRRFWLWAPFVVALIGVIALGGSWFWMRGKVERRLETTRTAATSMGWTMGWDRISISGFPFRLDVTLNGARVREPSGWGLAAPSLKAEAFIFAPSHWVAVAPEGVIVARRRGGPLRVDAKVLRASLSEADKMPPRLSVEGLGLTFTAPPGAAPFPLRSAMEFHLHTRSGPDDQGAVYLELDGAIAQVDGLLGRIANDKPATLVVDGIYSKGASLSGPSWPAALRHWATAGGRLQLRRLRLVAGRAQVDARRGDLGVGSDGRLMGTLDLVLRQAPRTLDAMGAQGVLAQDVARAAAMMAGAIQQGPTVSLPLSFQAGRTTLGPLAIGPAPRIY